MVLSTGCGVLKGGRQGPGKQRHETRMNNPPREFWDAQDSLPGAPQFVAMTDQSLCDQVGADPDDPEARCDKPRAF